MTTNWPPTPIPPPASPFRCNDEEVYVVPGSKPECQAQLRMSGPPNSGGGGAPQAAVLCWQLAIPPASVPSELTSGSCEPEKGCSVKLVMQLNIDPAAGAPEDQEFVNYWHGKDDEGPTWTTNAPSGTVTWGPPGGPVRDPTGDSKPILVVELDTENCGESVTADICAIPAGGGDAEQVCLTVILTCTTC